MNRTLRIVISALAVQAAVQQAPVGVDFREVMDQYRRGDADAAVEEFAAHQPLRLETLDPYAGSAPQRDRLAILAQALLHTEAGIRRRTFGQIAFSAPLVPVVPTVGLTGMFELHSLIAYRLISDALVSARADQATAHTFFVRDWYVIAVSYCRYEKRACAAALLAAAKRDFPSDPAILLLSGSIAETDGRRNNAAVLLRQALAADPALAEARLRLGRTLVALGQTTAGRRELERALADARAADDAFTQHFALRSLADLHARARRSSSALRAAATAVPPFDAATEKTVQGADVWAVYKAAQYWRGARMLAALRGLIRLPR